MNENRQPVTVDELALSNVVEQAVEIIQFVVAGPWLHAVRIAEWVKEPGIRMDEGGEGAAQCIWSPDGMPDGRYGNVCQA